jgi:DNA-cytosine methyltransferase
MGRNERCKEVLLLEDDSDSRNRKRGGAHPKIRLHRISSGRVDLLGMVEQDPCRTELPWRMTATTQLLEKSTLTLSEYTLVAGTQFGSVSFVKYLVDQGHPFVVEIPIATVLYPAGGDRTTIKDMVLGASPSDWTTLEVRHPISGKDVSYSVYSAGSFEFVEGAESDLLLVQVGAIPGIHRGTIAVLSSEPVTDYSDLIRSIGWARWIRPLQRKRLRVPTRGVVSTEVNSSAFSARPATLDALESKYRQLCFASEPQRRSASTTPLNIVELFAGAGGMGLGFLLANGKINDRYRILQSSEIHPVYVETLIQNHDAYRLMARREGDAFVPSRHEAVDLTDPCSLDLIAESTKGIDRVDLVIGGPPCQGFSSANRNSWRSDNPNNRLVDTYLLHLERLSPRAFVMENVEGIMYTPKAGQPGEENISVLDHVAKKMRGMGYDVYPVFVDAAEYGVPQHRNRFFVIGLHSDLGYGKGAFPNGKPFPAPTHGPRGTQPFVTVEKAIFDLPPIRNGATDKIMPYFEPSEDDLAVNPFLRSMREGAKRNVISDHVASRHTDYVLERFRRIPEGGNWHDIKDMLTNYADADRTHSNIYRRLDRYYPSITIGHYRKSMIVHPTQDRGLSLREASRLQSFPDWFRFAGSLPGQPDTIGHKQQQLANAVCPLLTKALAEYLAQLL